MYVCMYVHVCMYVCMYVYACMYACMCVCIYVCMYVCTYVCTCMFISMYSGTIRVVYQGEASSPMGIGSQNFNTEPGVDFNHDVMSIDMEGVASTVIEIPVNDISL